MGPVAYFYPYFYYWASCVFTLVMRLLIVFFFVVFLASCDLQMKDFVDSTAAKQQQLQAQFEQQTTMHAQAYDNA